MKTFNLKITRLAIICFISASFYCNAQEGSVSVNQDKKIVALLDLKKEMNKMESATDRYKIQIYSGNRATAEATRADFASKFSQWYPSIEFETPNYKVWVGNFRTNLEADKALKEIKQKFSNAFRLKPKK
jgi:SPOR domain